MKSSQWGKLLLGLLVSGILVCVCVTGAVAFWLVARPVSGEEVAEGEPLLNHIAFVGVDGNLWLTTPGGEEMRSVTDDGQGGTVWVLDTTGQEAPRQIGDGSFAVWSWQ